MNIRTVFSVHWFRLTETNCLNYFSQCELRKFRGKIKCFWITYIQKICIEHLVAESCSCSIHLILSYCKFTANREIFKNHSVTDINVVFAFSFVLIFHRFVFWIMFWFLNNFSHLQADKVVWIELQNFLSKWFVCRFDHFLFPQNFKEFFIALKKSRIFW